ncbi:MAG: hypothetical protein A2V66_02605 [Ignavibacteria bacterium RBG_13_36_8]|nr:MAG: hypothetical protein A2V66_02605 [Ignavibacteria bacterium RBG_13_36_8]
MSTLTKAEPWYIHAILYFIILVLAYILIDVAIIEPNYVMKMEKFWKTESRARMINVKEAEILWQRKHGKFTDSMDSLITFIKTDPIVANVIVGVDTVTGRPTNPFIPLSGGEFIPDSLFTSPKSGSPYLLKVDTTESVDTVINRVGRIISIDQHTEIGRLWKIECPDGYGKVGDLFSEALKNTASWE